MLNRKIDGDSEVVVCNGATETIYCALAGLVNPGDEVIMFEPAFDIYPAQTEQMGGVQVRVPLRVTTDEKDQTQRWSFDIDEFSAAFTPRSRILLLNTPHNPTGKVFTRSELEQSAEVVKKYPDVVVIADEVYEHLTFDDDKPHTRIATLPGMWERTLTISSSGKTFSVTGWKIGWAIGPKHLVSCVAIAHTWTVFSVATPLQRAVSMLLSDAESEYEGHQSYYHWLNSDYREKRALLLDALSSAGLTPIANEGSFFIMADTSSVVVPDEIVKAHPNETRDWHVARHLCVTYGVASIPCSTFYSDKTKDLAANVLRFAFCKPNEELVRAKTALSGLKK
jgi:aspartate/methionine/tyrosine aminotransferase